MIRRRRGERGKGTGAGEQVNINKRVIDEKEREQGKSKRDIIKEKERIHPKKY